MHSRQQGKKARRQQSNKATKQSKAKQGKEEQQAVAQAGRGPGKHWSDETEGAQKEAEFLSWNSCQVLIQEQEESRS